MMRGPVLRVRYSREGGNELRKLPLHVRKKRLERLLARRPEGSSSIHLSVARSVPISSRHRMGLEGLVSKHRDRPYEAGRSKHWVKVKNRSHAATGRVLD